MPSILCVACRHLSYFAGQPSPVSCVLDLWQVLVSTSALDEASSSSTTSQVNSLVDVLRRLAMYDVADVVQCDLERCQCRHQQQQLHSSPSRSTVHRTIC